MLALPISVLGTNFTNAWLDHKNSERKNRGARVSAHLQKLDMQLITHLTNMGKHTSFMPCPHAESKNCRSMTETS